MCMCMVLSPGRLICLSHRGPSSPEPLFHAITYHNHFTPSRRDDARSNLCAMTGATDRHNGLILRKFVDALRQISNMDMPRIRNVSIAPFVRAAYIQNQEWLMARPACVKGFEIH